MRMFGPVVLEIDYGIFTKNEEDVILILKHVVSMKD